MYVIRLRVHTKIHGISRPPPPPVTDQEGGTYQLDLNTWAATIPFGAHTVPYAGTQCQYPDVTRSKGWEYGAPGMGVHKARW